MDELYSKESVGIYLKLLTEIDISADYVAWMNDQDILQFLTGKQGGYSAEELKGYVTRMRESVNDHLFGIFLKEGDLHIGNIKIGNVNASHQFADIGLIIGRKDFLGKGYGTQAIKLATRYAFERLHLNKLIAGVMSENIGSFRAFQKAGYQEAGRYQRHVVFKGDYCDVFLLEVMRCEGEGGTTPVLASRKGGGLKT